MKKRVGNTNVMTCGLKCTVVAYYWCGDIDVEFENGKLVFGQTYHNFNRSSIKCPAIFKEVDDYIEYTNLNTHPPSTFLISKEDIEKVSIAYWSVDVRTGYAKNTMLGKLHRFLLDCPEELYIDHANGNRLDNRRENLRICTFSENLSNKWKPSRRKHSSKYKGVSKRGDKWAANISFNKKKYALGFYDTETQAAIAYNEAAKLYHGEFAMLNEVG